MTPNEYQTKAMETEASQGTIHEWVYRQGVEATRFQNGVRGLTDEVGELSAIAKRWLEYREPGLNRAHVLEECGDVLWRTAQILLSVGCTMEQAMEANIAKLQRSRYKGTVCNPEDAKEENRDRMAEAALRLKALAEDDGVEYTT